MTDELPELSELWQRASLQIITDIGDHSLITVILINMTPNSAHLQVEEGGVTRGEGTTLPDTAGWYGDVGPAVARRVPSLTAV